MLFRKLWRTMGLYKSQFISMAIMIALGIGVFIGFNMEWVSIKNNTEHFFARTGFADYRIVSEAGFSTDDLSKILEIDGVNDATRFLSISVDVKEYEGDGIALTVAENTSVSGFQLIDGENYDAQSLDGIWISDKYATANHILIGDSLTFVYHGLEITGKVNGLIKSGEYMICVRDETQLMPDHTTYGFAYISPRMLFNVLHKEYYPQINVQSEMAKKEFTSTVDQVLDCTMLILSKDENISYVQANGEVEEGKTMGSILPVLFLLIAVLTMVTTMHRLTAKEKIQIGTLKALGYKDKRILRHYTSYAFMIGLLGIGFGTALGYFIAWFIMNPNGMMGTYLDMPDWKLYLPWFCILILIAILLFLTLIGYLSVKKMLHGTAADALRPYAPKKMKNMLIERTKLFHQLSFGTRWNLRDTMRHKSRTAMSLIGIIGCMMILVFALGIRDTMNAFLDLYYDGATNYSSRIYMADEASQEQRDAIIRDYDGDWSSSISVQINEKAVSLDIYGITKDKVRFPDKNNDYVQLQNNGAYLCMRLAEEYDLSVGDTFTVSPYGSDIQYELTVAGILRSISENIVISDTYAKDLTISYLPDSIYTDVDKSSIALSSSIKNVQSKQMIVDSFDSFMDIMNIMIYVLMLAAVILGIVVLYNLGIMSYAERSREMATLKVVGFKDKQISKLLISQNIWTTLIGMIIGLPAGIGVLAYLLKSMASEYEMKLVLGPITYTVSILMTFIVSLLVSFFVARKNKKIDMVEALKVAE